ncbi:Tll0287-like domain-containing protein [Atopomonas sediminilitoris]|uniref:Tll0287-like domain-containing protein n=1 Tax=Atopomonas sediminilitoris TaxID=2919919 RepID=UPI001F4E71FF|nr:DUF3365 domain-containing protein [Atopomonas sediminilitoris]MCJ8170003.1 DUF3365 domain-containing protein [Atopomonas sediminilitoris]
MVKVGLGLLAALLSLPLLADNNAALEEEARDVTEAFMMSLKSSLKASLAEGGPVEAVQHCQQLAPALAEQYQRKGWHVARTSMKLRNPDNAPDIWELEQLIAFDKALSEGAAPASLSASVVEPGRFRYMQGIMVAPPCLACHGESLTPEIKQILDARYPHDKARGYTAGQLRGAFTLWKALPE